MPRASHHLPVLSQLIKNTWCNFPALSLHCASSRASKPSICLLTPSCQTSLSEPRICTAPRNLPAFSLHSALTVLRVDQGHHLPFCSRGTYRSHSCTDHLTPCPCELEYFNNWTEGRAVRSSSPSQGLFQYIPSLFLLTSSFWDSLEDLPGQVTGCQAGTEPFT